MSDKFGLKVHENDNVATIFGVVDCGEQILISDKKGRKQDIKAVSEIPYGHKLAIVDIFEGESVFKYGEVIGRATSSIKKGGHVHVHNMESLRGRGDFSSEFKQENADAI